MYIKFNLKKAINKIKEYKYISFDIFDTLIKRNVKNPSDIFIITQNRYNKDNEEKIKNFQKLRKDGDARARLNCNKEEITLEDIYNNIEGISKEKKKKLMNIELQVELDYCVANNKIYKLYEYCKKNNKQIICISDMYLPSNIVKKILIKNGYDIDNIFLSSEINKTKRTGNIYDYVIKSLNIEKSEIIHIGDNIVSDYLMPKKKKINAIIIANKIYASKYLKKELKKINNLKQNVILSTINNNLSRYNNYYEAFGYNMVGPILYFFVRWVYKEARKNNIKTLLFCARDMKLVQEIFSLYYKDIKNSYFYISRRSCYLPYLYKYNTYENVCKCFSYKYLTIKDRMDLYNIDVKKNDTLDFNKIYSAERLIQDKNFRKYYEKYIKKEIENKGKEQYEYLKKYTNSKVNNERKALVDLGWQGSTQFILNSLYDLDFYGLYFGIFDTYQENIEKCEGYCFNQKDKNFYKMKLSMILIERIFSASHGTTLKYTNLHETPYILKEIDTNNNKDVDLIQNGAKRFCIDMEKYNEDFNDEDTFYFRDRFINLLSYPKMIDAKMLGKIVCTDLVPKQAVIYSGWKTYIKSPKKFFNDFKDSTWKIGFAKQAFKLTYDWYKIANVLRKKKTNYMKKRY